MTREEIREGIIKFFTPPNTVRKSGTILDDNIKGVVDELLKYLHSEGVVIKVERELPLPSWEEVKDTALSVDSDTWANMLAMVGAVFEGAKKAGYVAVEPLIEVK